MSDFKIGDHKPLDLTAASHWQYRLITDAVEGPWCDTFLQATEGLLSSAIPMPWPQSWTVFGPIRHDDSANSLILDSATLRQVPDLIEVGKSLHPITLRCDEQHRIDFRENLGPSERGDAVWAFASFDLAVATRIRLHLSCDYWMAWWIDGQPLIENLSTGNLAALMERATPVDIDLQQGRHVLACKIVSGSGGWAMAGEMHQMPQNIRTSTDHFELECRKTFVVSDPEQFRWLALLGPDAIEGRLNGQPIPTPMKGMRYREISGLPVNFLRQGLNVLQRSYDKESSAAAIVAAPLQYFKASGANKRIIPEASVLGLVGRDAIVQSGPILTDVGPAHVAIACRLNVPTGATLRIANRTFDSAPGSIHRWQVSELQAATEYRYQIVISQASTVAAEGSFRTLPIDGEVELAICADAGPLPDVWKCTAEAIATHSPNALVFTGDLVDDGCRDGDWDPQFFHPAKKLLANTPLFSVLGNHDGNSPLYSELLLPLGFRTNWCRRFGPALLIGIDGAADWSADGPLTRWLTGVLAESVDRFVFVFNHYPAWSSGPHQDVDASGEMREPPCRNARHILLPLLAQYAVSAIFSGHDHFYERSEIPGGPVCIVTGGAGAYLYRPSQRPNRNPYSRCLISQHHFCMLRLGITAARLSAIALDGRVLDEFSFLPRFNQSPGHMSVS